MVSCQVTWPQSTQLFNSVGEGMVLKRPRSWGQTPVAGYPCFVTRPRIHLACLGTCASGCEEPRWHVCQRTRQIDPYLFPNKVTFTGTGTWTYLLGRHSLTQDRCWNSQRNYKFCNPNPSELGLFEPCCLFHCERARRQSSFELPLKVSSVFTD